MSITWLFGYTLISKDYNLSVWKIGKLEVDFIARLQNDNCFYNRNFTLKEKCNKYMRNKKEL